MEPIVRRRASPESVVDFQAPRSASVPSLPLLHGLVLVGVLLVLNSILASLGSILWFHIPYWPAFMVWALVCAYWGIWGVVLAVLSPVLSSLLGIGGAPSYLYVPVNLFQALLVLLSMRVFSIRPELPGAVDKAKYLGLAVLIPSLCGGVLAWLLRSWYNPNPDDSAPLAYIGLWTLENAAPVIFPGFWLHKIVGEASANFGWEAGKRPTPWMVTVFAYTVPWLISLILGCLTVVVLVSSQLRVSGNSPDMWNNVNAIASESLVLRGLIFSLSVSILLSLGSTMRFARRSWILEDEINKRLPHKLTERPPTGEYLSTVLFSDIRGFTAQSSSLQPHTLVTWLNRYFDRMCEIATQRHGMVDKFIGDGLMVVFGLNDGDAGSSDAILCAMEMIRASKVLNEELSAEGYPEITIGIGVHTGRLVAGEIGSRNRLQYTVVGNTVNIASRLESASKDLPHTALPVVISGDTVSQAGLLPLNECKTSVLRKHTLSNLKGVPTMTVWTISDVAEVEAFLRAGQGRGTDR